jgi:hydrogenase expression/formation protein HypC
MCLAIPARILSITGPTAELELAGNRLTADVSMVPDAVIGDYVMVHAGFAIQKYDEDEALKTLDLLREVAAAMTGDGP